MKQITSLEENITQDSVITVGKFDGIHKGHELLIEQLLSFRKEGLCSVVVTFDISPRIHLKKDLEKQLVTNRERNGILEKQGLDYLVQCPFEQIMPLEPEAFVDMMIQKWNMKVLVCGTDFRFGKKGRGDVELLRQLSKTMGFRLVVIDKLKQDDRDISSTYVREEIAKGNIEKGNALLGYEYFVWGQVVHGNHLGTKIGIPTINILPEDEKLLPPYGVYVTTVEVDHRCYHGVTNVGVKPTIEGNYAVGVETHILDFQEDIYEKFVKISFLQFLRKEKKFSGVDELCQQMKIDKEKARNYFNSLENVT